MTPNESIHTFQPPHVCAIFHQSNKNCDRRSDDRLRQKDANDFMIYFVLCYRNWTDNKRVLLSLTVKHIKRSFRTDEMFYTNPLLNSKDSKVQSQRKKSAVAASVC